MSPLVLLGSLATAVSTISILPHLVHAVRNRKPAGAAYAWSFGAFSSGLWFVYGFAIGDIWVAAPGFVTIPVGLGLAVWCVVHARNGEPESIGAAVAPAQQAAAARIVRPTHVPAEWEQALACRAGDTLEMPRIAV